MILTNQTNTKCMSFYGDDLRTTGNQPVCCSSARTFDRQPVLKALICKHNFPPCLDTLVNTFLGGQNFYLPSPLMPRSLADFTKQSFRFPVGYIIAGLFT